MPRTVSEIMNRELFSLRTVDGAKAALGYILGLGIIAAPVLGTFGPGSRQRRLTRGEGS